MIRKRSIIILVLLLLLIVGGAGFYLHLRKQAPPDFKEVDRFMRQVPATSGWTLTDSKEEKMIAPDGQWPWLRHLGIHRKREFITRHYGFIRNRPGRMESGFFVVRGEGDRVASVQIGFPPSNHEEMTGMVSGKFPRLAYTLIGNPYSAPPALPPP